MKSHISRITSACFYQLRRLRAVRGQLGQEDTGRLVSAFILSRLDYCNAVLAGPASTLAPLQRVMHAAARVIYDIKQYDHVTPTLKALHWLPVKQRIEFKLCLLVHLVINKRAPVYLQNLLTTTASVPGRASNRSASNNDLVKQSTRLKLGECAFSVAGPRVWNRLPTHLKAITDTRVLGANFLIFLSILLAHTDIVLAHRSFVGDNTVYYLYSLYLCLYSSEFACQYTTHTNLGSDRTYVCKWHNIQLAYRSKPGALKSQVLENTSTENASTCLQR